MPSDTPPPPLNYMFDPRGPGKKDGKEHYFHFLHGYLLPGLSHALARGRQSVRFEYCGPLMQPRIAEACALLSLDLAPPLPADVPREGRRRKVPRWDKLLLRYGAPPQPPCVLQGYRAGSRRVRRALLDAARRATLASGSLARWRETDVLVFERSPEHPYYQSPKTAGFEGYGRSRRHLKNSRDIADALCAGGLRAEALDLGALSLADQIMACHHAKAVFGVRGAEFANLFWMRPASAAVMLATPIDRENHGSRSLAAIYGVHFLSPPVDTQAVEFDPAQAVALIRAAMQPPAGNEDHPVPEMQASEPG